MDAARATHLMLLAGRLLYGNGAETEIVATTVERLGRNLGCEEARCAVTFEHLIVTTFHGQEFRTQIGRHPPALGVDMALVASLLGRLEQAPETLPELETVTPVWPSALVVVLVGLTSASLSRLFGGDWSAFLICLLAASGGMILRLKLRGNPYLTAFAAALLSGVVGCLLAPWSSTPGLCLLAPGMVIVPGVPLVNAVLDVMRNHVTMGLARLTHAGVILVSICLGLVIAHWATGARFPLLEMATGTPPLEQVIFFSGVSALGYAALFNVPWRMVWGCLACGCLSFTLRVVLVERGLGIPLATFAAALVVGGLSLHLARSWHAPPAVFAFPGIVAMIPGAFAFRAASGLAEWTRLGPETPLWVLATSGSLLLEVLLVTGAIALGLALPALIRRPGRSAG